MNAAGISAVLTTLWKWATMSDLQRNSSRVASWAQKVSARRRN